MSRHMDTLRGLAERMDDELQRQDAIVVHVDDATTQQTAALAQLSARIKPTKCGARQVVIWIVLVTVLLILAAMIWQLVS